MEEEHIYRFWMDRRTGKWPQDTIPEPDGVQLATSMENAVQQFLDAGEPVRQDFFVSTDGASFTQASYVREQYTDANGVDGERWKLNYMRGFTLAELRT